MTAPLLTGGAPLLTRLAPLLTNCAPLLTSRHVRACPPITPLRTGALWRAPPVAHLGNR